MAYLDRDEDTICALTTGAGRSGIAVIRVSGPEAFNKTKQLCSFLPDQPESHRIYYGLLKDHKHSHAIDEVLVSFFSVGRSYTGDQTCEISSHGNPLIASQILSELVQLGCRLADRGEFTFRAFMNGKIDLVQAESVLSLIESTSKKATQLALDQLQGQLSKLFEKIETDIIWILSRVEAGIDFSEEGLEIISDEEVQRRLQQLIDTCGELIASYNTGRLLTDGINIVLAGKPNAGKSSLLNALVKSERAIVSPQAGTTRDTVEANYKVNGISATLTDTAGLRETDDDVERQGVERSLKAVLKSDLVLYVLDSSAVDVDVVRSELENFKNQKVFIVLNKIDLISKADCSKLCEGFSEQEIMAVSATTGVGLNILEEKIRDLFSFESSDETTVVIQARHEHSLKKSLVSLTRARESLSAGLSHEFVCVDLREALASIGSLLGRSLGEDVINRIFKDFCIGK